MSTCIVCGAKMQKNSQLKGLLKCPRCGFVCADMHLSFEELERIYSRKYFEGQEYTDYLSDETLHKRNFSRRLKTIRKVTGSLSESKVFEIGCAYGLFLDVVQNQAKEVSGIDISLDAVNYAQEKMGNEVVVTQGDYLATPTKFENYDLICMWDTIEHLSEPQKYLEKMNREVKPNGHICITTGDIGSLNARFRGAKWRQIHPPTHLQYFSKKTLIELLKRSGFRTIHVSYPGNELSLRNIAYSILCLRMRKNNVFSLIENWKILNLCFYINLHDYIFIIAEKEKNIGNETVSQ